MSLYSKKVEALCPDLIQAGVLTKEQWEIATETRKNLGTELPDILLQRGFLTEEVLTEHLAKKYGYRTIRLDSEPPTKKALALFTLEQAQTRGMIPVGLTPKKLTVAVWDPFDLNLIDTVKKETGKELDLVLCPRGEIEAGLKRFYSPPREEGKPEVEAGEIEIVRYGEDSMIDPNSPLAQLQREAEADSFVAAVNQIILRATREGASDIHLEPVRENVKIRMRIDGMLTSLPDQPKAMHQAMISRIKILGDMDVAERRLPQDGRVRLKLSGKELDLRIATYPTIFGEACAIRLLSKEQLRSLEDVGFSPRDKEVFEDIIKLPYGIFLVTGPTGSGKSTTLYAALQGIDRKTRHVLSVEDPVEHEIDGVSQTQIHTKAGVTFAGTLRSMLREDPDVIMVGEIRDQETADIALRAAMTGHLVFSTLHTNSALGSVARLVDMGIEPFLISSTVIGLMAQRLVRRICPHCKEPAVPQEKELVQLGPKARGIHPFKGRGCRQCRMTGYKGRLGLFELVRIDDEMRVLIQTHSPEIRMREKATAAGSLTLKEDGIEKIKAGMTTIEEVLRVTV